MRAKLLPLLLVVALVSTGFRDGHQKMLDRATGSVVRITGETLMMTWAGPFLAQYSCTGFVIDTDRVLTAAHCLGDKMTADGFADVKVLKADTFYDLALLQVRINKPALKLREKPVERGEHVTGLGYGWGFTQVTPIEGTVMLVDYVIPVDDPEDALPPLIFVQGEYIGGMSGGPVLDGNGQVVGMVQMKADGAGMGVGTLLIRAFLLGV